ncbi:MAG: hypothetical protein QOE90_812 [Thermoplasmata archaeon]|jgi:hypothetical protein|nr:hypothetical protein [Thermoplasmata archaeon]
MIPEPDWEAFGRALSRLVETDRLLGPGEAASLKVIAREAHRKES